jgi:type I restriction enzyme R subunit
MWLTGFDVKSLSCLYIDKPLKAHTLMQTISRANRVDEGKPNGLIIDYIGIVKALRKALADYTTTRGGGGSDGPAVDKSELFNQLKEAIALAKAHLHEHGFELQRLIDATGFEKMALLQDAADAMCESIEVRKTYCGYASHIAQIMKFITFKEITEPRVLAEKDAVIAIYKQLQQKRKHADITELSVAINKIVSDYVGTQPEDELTGTRRIDISKIDFDLLKKEFSEVKHKKLMIADLEAYIKKLIEQMMRANPSRINFYEEYQRIITEYNAEQDRASIERTFDDLIKLSQSLNTEQQRFSREGFTTEEQLAMYDLLFDPNISKNDIQKLKNFAVLLLDTIKAKIAELHNWREKPATRSEVDTLIRDTLWDGLPQSYTDEQIGTYRKRIYEYFFERYPIIA